MLCYLIHSNIKYSDNTNTFPATWLLTNTVTVMVLSYTVSITQQTSIVTAYELCFIILIKKLQLKSLIKLCQLGSTHFHVNYDKAHTKKFNLHCVSKNHIPVALLNNSNFCKRTFSYNVHSLAMVCCEICWKYRTSWVFLFYWSRGKSLAEISTPCKVKVDLFST